MKPIAISVSQALASERLFAPFFAGSSWNTWKAVVKAMFGEPLNTTEHELFHAVAERDPPRQPVPEMAAVAGRGAGKDSVATVIAAVMAVEKFCRRERHPRSACRSCDSLEARG